MKLSTDTQKEAAKLLLKAASQKPLERVQATQILTSQEHGVYERNRDAKELIKEIVNDEEFPINKESGKLVRTDMEVA